MPGKTFVRLGADMAPRHCSLDHLSLLMISTAGKIHGGDKGPELWRVWTEGKPSKT